MHTHICPAETTLEHDTPPKGSLHCGHLPSGSPPHCANYSSPASCQQRLSCTGGTRGTAVSLNAVLQTLKPPGRPRFQSMASRSLQSGRLNHGCLTNHVDAVVRPNKSACVPSHRTLAPAKGGKLGPARGPTPGCRSTPRWAPASRTPAPPWGGSDRGTAKERWSGRRPQTLNKYGSCVACTLLLCVHVADLH